MIKFNLLLRKFVVLSSIIGSCFISTFSQSLILTSPSSGDNWECGSVETISWSGTGISANVRMDISPDGSNWRNIAYSPNDGSEAWFIHYLKQTTSSIRMRIYEAGVSGIPISDTSGTFTLSVSTPDPSEPNDDSSGAYVLSPGDSVGNCMIPFVFSSGEQDFDWFCFTGDLNDRVAIRYHFYDYFDFPNFRVYVYNPDGSYLTGKSIFTPSYLNDSILINLPETGKYYIKVQGYNWDDCCGYSLVLKERTSGTLTLQSPSSGDNWECGSTETISWSGTGISANVRMDISPDGSTWRNVDYTQNDGSEAWFIHSLKQTTSSIRMRIYEAGVSGIPISDTSGTFTLTVSTPDPSEPNDDSSGSYVLSPGDSVGNCMIPFVFSSGEQDFDWFCFTGDLNDRVSIRYHFYDYFDFPNFRVYVYNPDGSYLTGKSIFTPSYLNDSIRINLPETGKYYIKVQGYNWDDCGGYSLVYENYDSGPIDSITITSPNGGETYIAGASTNITWSHTGTVGNVKIEYSINNGSDWTTVITSTENDGTHPWTVPGAASTNCKIRISEATDGDPVDESDAVFTIEPAPAITVTSPDGGEIWLVGSQHAITWTSIGTVGNVRIEYSTNGGSDWTEIIAGTANDGTHPWTIPDMPSSSCKVRISEASGGSPSDESNAVFTILPAPSLTVLTPNGGEIIILGTSYAITWSSTGTVGDVKIEYTTDNGSTWVPVIANTANDGSHTWSVPTLVSTNCKIRISESSDNNPFDESDVVFTIDNQAETTDGPDTKPDQPSVTINVVPNPVSKNTQQEVVFQITPKKDITNGVLLIYDPFGNKVCMIEVPYCHANKLNTVGSWDIRNKAGRKVANGAYLGILKVVDFEGNIEVVNTVIGIKE